MNRYYETRKVAILGIFANLLLLILKLVVGFISGSQAMIADGFNSAGDIFTSAATFAGNKIASKPEDRNHPYGHGKAEYIFSMMISFSLLLVAYKIFHSSLNSIIKRETFTFSFWLVGVAAVTIVLKLTLFIYTRNIGRKEDNLLILANSEDHRNDVFVTSAALLGIIFGRYGIFIVDGIVGIIISFWVAYTALRIFSSSYHVLMDTNMDDNLKKDILHVILSIPGVDHVDEITAKPIGVSFIIIVKVSVPGNMTVEQGHGIAAQIRQKIKGCKRVGDVVVHINPA